MTPGDQPATWPAPDAYRAAGAIRTRSLRSAPRNATRTISAVAGALRSVSNAVITQTRVPLA